MPVEISGQMNIDLSTIALIVTIVTAASTLTWWLSGQFKEVRRLVYEQVDQLRNFVTSKLEDHEKQDSQRFHVLSNDIWSIKIRNAARDGIAQIKVEETRE